MSAELIVARLKDWRAKRPTLFTVITLVGGTAAAQVITLCCSPIVTRLYSPEDFGVYAVFTAAMSYLCLSTCRFELAIPSANNDERRALILLSIAGAASVSLAIAISILVFDIPAVLSLLGLRALTRYIWLFPAGLLLASITQVLGIFATSEERYRTLSVTKTIQAVAGNSSSIVLGNGLPASWGLLWAQMVQYVCGGTILLAVTVGNRGGLRTSFELLKKTLDKYKYFSLLSVGAGMLNLAGTSLPPILYASEFGKSVAGSFAFAYRIVSLPMALVGAAIAQVFIGRSSGLNSKLNHLHLFRGVTKKMTILGLVLIAAGATAPWVFPIVFGASWKDAGHYSAILTVSAAAQIAVSPISATAFIYRRQGTQLALDAMRAVLVVAAVSVPAHYGMPALLSVCCYAVAMSFVYVTSYFCYKRIIVLAVKQQ